MCLRFGPYAYAMGHMLTLWAIYLRFGLYAYALGHIYLFLDHICLSVGLFKTHPYLSLIKN